MERLKSLDLQLHIETDFSQSPITISQGTNGQVLPIGKHVYKFTLEKISHIEKIQFKGFDPFDKKQKVKLSLWYRNRQLDLNRISCFHMDNNRYVENVTLSGVTEVCFNGSLELKFFASWFSCNLLQGGVLVQDKKIFWKHYTDYLNPMDACLNTGETLKNDEHYDVIFSGTCFTGTEHAEYTDKIPSTIQYVTHRKITNLSFNGINADACLENAHIIVDNYKLKTLIFSPSKMIWMPTRTRFLDAVYVFCCTRIEKRLGDFNIFADIRKTNLMQNKRKAVSIKKYITKKFLNLAKKCKDKGIDLIVISFTKNPNDFWHEYKAISVEMCQDPKDLANLIK